MSRESSDQSPEPELWTLDSGLSLQLDFHEVFRQFGGGEDGPCGL